MCLWETSDLSEGHTDEKWARDPCKGSMLGVGECWTNRVSLFIEKQDSCLRDVSSGET